MQTVSRAVLFSALLVLFHLQTMPVYAAGFLRVSGEKLLDSSGKELRLEGFNVSFKYFRGVLGEEDIKKIAGLGADCIRLVLDYRDFESAPFRYREDNFKLLSRVLGWAEKYGVYVVLDMHLAPGIQNPHDFVFHRGKSYRFWSDEVNQERYYALLFEFARRYRERGIVAAYDLLNEGVPPDIVKYTTVMNRAANTIRTIDRRHILIVEEAIMTDGGKELRLIDDDNVIYSIHFYFPDMLALYAALKDRAIAHYPGEIAIQGEKISEARSETISGTAEWRKVSISAVPPEGAEVFLVALSSDRNAGKVWFDDVSLEVDGLPVDLPAPLLRNSSFESGYPGLSWKTLGGCASVTKGQAKTGRRSLVFSGCGHAGIALSSPIEVKRGEYRLTAWVKSDGATGRNRIKLIWFRKKVLSRIDKTDLMKQLEYALSFRRRFNVPLYVGEFTAHANPSEQSVVNYLGDLLQIMKDEDLHWTYWEYYSDYPGIAIYSSDSALSRPEALGVLRHYLTVSRQAGR